MATDMKTVKAIQYNNKSLKNIKDSNGNIIWGSQADYPYRRLKYIIFTGFVYKYEDEKFVLGREEMNCCAADSYIIGIKSLANEKFKVGQWIIALGKISYDGEYYLEIEEYKKIKEQIIQLLEEAIVLQNCKNYFYQQQYISLFANLEYFLYNTFMWEVCQCYESYQKVLVPLFVY